MEKVVIVGSGPAGLTAAIYTARAALNPLVIAGLQPGGQLTTTSIIENWPGFEDGIDGTKLMTTMNLQAQRMGARILNQTVERLDSESSHFILTLDGGDIIKSQSVIVATGASALTLKLPQESKLMGYGLSTCAVCDGFFYKNKKVAVVGGGDSAMEEALYLAKLAESVLLIHRKSSFNASKIMQERALAHPKISVLWNTEVVDTQSGEQGLTDLILKKADSSQLEVLPIDGLFMAIGHKPNTKWLSHLIHCDSHGYIKTQNGTHTNIPGCFAAGDVEDPLYRQAITASGRGCQAALQAEKYLSH